MFEIFKHFLDCSIRPKNSIPQSLRTKYIGQFLKVGKERGSMEFQLIEDRQSKAAKRFFSPVFRRIRHDFKSVK